MAGERIVFLTTEQVRAVASFARWQMNVKRRTDATAKRSLYADLARRLDAAEPVRPPEPVSAVGLQEVTRPGGATANGAAFSAENGHLNCENAR